MKKRLLTLIASGLLATPMLAIAVPVQYDLTFDSTVGPDGYGSFVFDGDTGAMTGFGWNFDGIVGGISDAIFASSFPFGDTLGRFVFEFLTGEDVHPGVLCHMFRGCSSAMTIDVGAAPYEANGFGLSGTPTGTLFNFQRDSSILLSGTVAIGRGTNPDPDPPTEVPEPTTLGLLGLGLMMLPGTRRLRRS